VTPRDYVLDRIPLLLSFGVALVFLLLVIHLGVRPLSPGEVGYIALLATVATAVVLTLDYQRHRVWRREVARRLSEHDYGAAPLPAGASREQRAMAALLGASQAAAAEELQRRKAAAEQHRAFTDLWVHQMKTPLAVLELTAEQQPADLAGSVAEEVEALSAGLELMLTTSRLERFELDVKPALTDLGALARDTVNDLKRSWIRASVYPRFEAPHPTDPATPPVTAETDPKWLQVVLRQLLTNSIKYSHAGATVTITVAAEDQGASIRVSDTGVGIAPEDLPRVFERFYTGSNGRHAKAATGMGLFLAAEICRRLGHELSLTSAPGQGTTARVTLTPRSLHRLGETSNVTTT